VAELNTSNAHVRGKGKRHDKSVIADEADRLLNDPAFVRAFDVLEESIINMLCSSASNGSIECDDAEREMVRVLRTGRSLKRILAKTIQGEKLRLADFKPHKPESED
jgi:hypothetical protein